MRLRDIIEAILSEPPVAFHSILAKICGNANAGLMLSQAMYWSKTKAAMERGGWFYKTARDWYDEICLSRHEQDTAKRILKEKGFIDIDTRRAGREMTPTLHFKVNIDAVSRAVAAYAEKRQTGLAQASAEKRQTEAPESGKPGADNQQTEAPESGNSYKEGQSLPPSTTSIGESAEQPALLPLPRLRKRKDAKPPDLRFAGICKAIRTVWPQGRVCDIDGRDARALSSYLDRKPAFPGEELELCVVFRSMSQGVNFTEPVRQFVGDLDKYQSGPLNTFGDPLYTAAELEALRDQARVILYGELPVQQRLPKAAAPSVRSAFLSVTPGESRPEVYDSLRNHLQLTLGHQVFSTWIKPTRFLVISEGVLYVEVPLPEFSNLGQRYAEPLRKWIEAQTAITRVNFIYFDDERASVLQDGLAVGGLISA